MRDVTPPAEGGGRGRFPWLNLALLALTLLTTTAAGAGVFREWGLDPFRDPAGLLQGLPFSLTLMAILGGHELAHFLASRRHGVPATLPFFIPAPTPIGTFGAVITMRGAIWHRRALLDIGASGPLAGFLLSLPPLFWGIAHSRVVVGTSSGGGFFLGESLAVQAVSRLVLGPLPDNAVVLINPVGFAAWIGLFVTALNLLPVGQLDGGHILHALLPRWSRLVARGAHLSLIVLGAFFWEGWLIWALLLAFLGVGHPPVLFPEAGLDRRRTWIGWFSLVVLVLTFSLTPFGTSH